MKIKISKIEWEKLGSKTNKQETNVSHPTGFDMKKLAAIMKARFEKVEKLKLKTAINNINPGVDTKQAVPNAPIIPTQKTDKEEKAELDFVKNLDTSHLNMDQWEDKLSPDKKQSLQFVPGFLARKMKEMGEGFVSTLPKKEKEALERIMDVAKTKPAKANLIFQQLMREINRRQNQHPPSSNIPKPVNPPTPK